MEWDMKGQSDEIWLHLVSAILLFYQSICNSRNKKGWVVRLVQELRWTGWSRTEVTLKAYWRLLHPDAELTAWRGLTWAHLQKLVIILSRINSCLKINSLQRNALSRPSVTLNTWLFIRERRSMCVMVDGCTLVQSDAIPYEITHIHMFLFGHFNVLKY